MSPRRAVLPVLACLLVASACGSETGASSTEREDRERDDARLQMYDMAADERATPAEIVEAGGPIGVVESGTGHRLVSYLVESNDGEGPQAAAWRLYDENGAQVAEGAGIRVSEASARPDLWPLPDGVLMAPDSTVREGLVKIADDGTVTEVPHGDGKVAARPGDVLVGLAELYRPADGATYRLVDVPGTRNVYEAVLDDDGGLWLLRESAGQPVSTVLHCPDGGPPCTETTVPNDGTAFVDALDLADGRVYAPVVEPSMDGGGLRALHVADPATGTWSPVDITGVVADGWYLPRVSALDDGTLLLGDSGTTWFAGGAGDWRPVGMYDGADDDFTSLYAVGGALYATGRVPEDAHVSTDLGQSWDVLGR